MSGAAVAIESATLPLDPALLDPRELDSIVIRLDLDDEQAACLAEAVARVRAGRYAEAGR